MFENIFNYVEELVKIVKPRNLVYMAIDGVAPRAKMNQQRARRFRKVQEEREKAKSVPTSDFKFDSNFITPGTPFMYRLGKALHSFILRKLETTWKNLQVIFSDSNNPGEGEHKILEFIRIQRSLPSHNPNIKHVIFGADADLIMLSLITHEAHFYIIRENLMDFRSIYCRTCGQQGHFEYDCQGRAKNEESVVNTKFQFIKVPVLRQYLFYEFKELTHFLHFDFERIIDDFVFLCFFVGNDFLPHLPSMHIRDGAIDGLIYLYNKIFYKLGGYLTENGKVILYRVDLIMLELSKIEEEYFKEKEDREAFIKKRNDSYKRKNESDKNLEAAEKVAEETEDSIRLGQEGWKLRYYSEKFKVTGAEVDEFRHRIHLSYMEGLSWVFEYYFQGCTSWGWYFPFHYAPFASDLYHSHTLKINFQLGIPFQPYAQLLSVLPAESCIALPKALQDLVLDEASELSDFYPIDFKLDINGKRFSWQGVMLLPFIEENRLLQALSEKVLLLSDEENLRNSLGESFLYSNREIPGINMKFTGKVPKFPVYSLDTGCKVRFDIVQNHDKTRHLCKKLDGVVDPEVEVDDHVFKCGDRRGFGGISMINMISKHLALEVQAENWRSVPQQANSYEQARVPTEKKLKPNPPQDALVDNLKKLVALLGGSKK
jgi:5'-3' exonuclease